MQPRCLNSQPQGRIPFSLRATLFLPWVNFRGMKIDRPGAAIIGAVLMFVTGAPYALRVPYLEYPELELSNNLAENSMRPVALGRKNWIHVGSAQAGPKIAAILSVVESCRRLKLPVSDYLGEVFPGSLIARSSAS